MKISDHTISTRVLQLKSFFECLAEIMGFLAGFSFLSRLMKHILDQHKVGSSLESKYINHLERIQKMKEELHQVFALTVSP